MREYLTLGPTPCDELCAQVGDPDYHDRATLEVRRYIDLLVKKFGDPPGGAYYTFGMKSFPHDYGSYWEAVIYYDTELPETVEFAFRVENNLPATWED